MKRLAIFDFCGTLVSFQTADRFVDFVCAARPTRTASAVETVRRTLRGWRLLHGSLHKRVHLLRLRGMDSSWIDRQAARYLTDELLPNEYPEIARRLAEHRDRGDTVVINSAGLSCYLRRYAEMRGIETVIGVELAVAGGRLTGRIQGPNTYGRKKVEILRRRFDLAAFDLAGSSVYSDSLTDLPLFELVGRRYFVTAGAVPEAVRADGGFTVLEVASTSPCS